MIWVGVFGTLVFIPLLCLSIDVGKVRFHQHELQNASDAGALAGAQVVKTDPLAARQDAIATAFANRVDLLEVSVADNPDNDIDGEVVLGRWIRQERRFEETAISPTAVKVVGRRLGQRNEAPALLLPFPWAGTDKSHVWKEAIAWAQGSTGAGIIVLADDPIDPPLPGWNHPTGLLIDGGTTVDLRGVDWETGEEMVGDIQVNALSESPPWSALRVDGSSADIWAGEINVVGGTNPDADTNPGAWTSLFPEDENGETVSFSVNPGSPRLGDPLGDLIPPDISTMPPGTDAMGKKYYTYDDPATVEIEETTCETITGGPLTLNPGYYPGGMYLKGGEIRLNPGVYAFGGINTDVKGQPSGLVVTGGELLGDEEEGVLLYITGDPDGSKTHGMIVDYGRIDLGGSGAIEIISRGAAQDLPLNDDADPEHDIQLREMHIAIWQDRANPSYGKIIGTSAMEILGTIYCGYNAMELGGSSGQTGNQVIAGALWLHGDPGMGIAYDGRNGAEGNRSVLVQ
jgi:hypothetical protein